MARKRKRKRRMNPVPLLLTALLLVTAVIWAILPRKQPRAPIARATPTQSAAPHVSPQVSRAPRTAAPLVSPSAVPSGKAQLAVIIDDCGQWPDIERAFIALPVPLTLSVMPHVRYTAQIAQDASAAGKGVMLHLPMEPLSHKYAGAGEITIAMTDEEVDAQTNDDIAQVPPATGLNNHEGSAASADPRVMKDVLQVAKEHGLFFIDSRTNKATVAAAVAASLGVPDASRNVFLDNKADVAYSESMLLQAADIALKNGSAIAIGHPKATTLQALSNLYPRLEARGVQFVLAAQLVR